MHISPDYKKFIWAVVSCFSKYGIYYLNTTNVPVWL